MQVRDFRLTVVYRQAFFGLLKKGELERPWAYLVKRLWHRVAFNGVRSAAPEHADLDHPWRSKQKSNFWTHYLGGLVPDSVTAKEAWEHLVPFRLTERPAMVRTDLVPDRLLYECYGFPHGLVLTLTLRSRDAPRALDEFVERARSLRLDTVFTLSWTGGAMDGGLTMDSVADNLLKWFRERYYGEVADVQDPANPVSIVTVVQGDGVDLTKAVDVDLQRRLHAISAWPVTWKTAALPVLAQGSTLLPVMAKNLGPADCVYATARGRAVWMPSLFTLKPQPGAAAKKPHQLGCLHHNLAAATVQAEGLCAFADRYADAARKPDGLSGIDTDLPKHVCSLIARLHDGTRATTYRSGHVRALIDRKECRAAINTLCERTGTENITWSNP